MTPTELRNERLAERMIKQLKRRNMEAFYCPTAAEAVKKVSELIADGSSVTWGGSMTIRDIGIPQALKGWIATRWRIVPKWSASMNGRLRLMSISQVPMLFPRMV